MSGIIPQNTIVVSTPVTQNGYPTPYRIISFPTRVHVTGLSFTVDANTMGDLSSDGRYFYLAAVKGKRAKGYVPGDDSLFAEDIAPFFGDNAKPEIYTENTMFLSNIVAPVDTYWFWAYHDSYEGQVAQMDTDEYLTVWVVADGGNYPEDFDWAATTATISISYKGATNLD